MIDRLVWYVSSIRSIVEASPMFRAALVCMVLYQLDLLLLIGTWLARRAGMVSTDFVLEPGNRKSAVVVLPTLLRNRGELDGLVAAMRSVAQNGYPGRLFVIACVDGIDEAGRFYEQLLDFAEHERVPTNIELHVAGNRERLGKAVAMDQGIEYLKELVAARKAGTFPELFFNMDADSVLGPRALERMVFRLTRKRRLTGSPRHIVTSNVVVPFEQCYQGPRSLLSLKRWIALLVAHEYVGSISAGKMNRKLSPVFEVSGALYCTWSEIYLAAPYYAAFLQQLRLRDWIKWWFGCAPPRFSEFRGKPLPEAMTGPGDDTWMGWFASCCAYRQGRFCVDFPRTPLHALAATFITYLSRPVGYDPLAKVYSKTPTTFRGLFKQRLRWNSSRIQDLLRSGPALLYHWKCGIPLLLGTALTFTAITLFAMTPLAALVGTLHLPASAPAISLLAFAGYVVSRLTGTLAGLLISESPRREWIKLVALPLAVPYHITFNTLTLLVGYYRDAFGFGEPTTFAPERTLLRSNLSRLAIAYRLRRALLLTVRSAAFGDVPLGAFWVGWGRTPFTPSGFEGWGSGRRPAAIFWPRAPKRTSPLDVREEIVQPDAMESAT